MAAGGSVFLGDEFGSEVSISGNTVVVGTISANAAYVFTEPNLGWASITQTAKLTASDRATVDDYGPDVRRRRFNQREHGGGGGRQRESPGGSLRVH